MNDTVVHSVRRFFKKPTFFLFVSIFLTSAIIIIINCMKKDRKDDKNIPKITHLVFMRTSYDVKEKVYVALVDNSEALK